MFLDVQVDTKTRPITCNRIQTLSTCTVYIEAMYRGMSSEKIIFYKFDSDI